MNGNQLLIIGILKTHFDGLTQDQLLDKLQYTNKKYKIENIAINKPTLIKTLKELEENKYITYENTNKDKIYILNKKFNFIINYGIIMECIKGFITVDELELYFHTKNCIK